VNILKIIGIGIGAVVGLAVLGFLVLLALMIFSSKSGYAKIETLKNEYTPGASVDTLIKRADELKINSVFWDDGDQKFNYDEMNISREKINFKEVNENFQKLNSGNVGLLAYGAMPLERFILSITFENRIVVKTDIRIID
jgi:hypothetical protein